MPRRDHLSLLDRAVRDAWEEYLESTKGLESVRYEEVESWAWARLSKRLRSIEARRERVVA